MPIFWSVNMQKINLSLENWTAGAKNERQGAACDKWRISKLLCIGVGLSALLNKAGYSRPLLLR